ncbi:SWI/SNF complex subunit SWI3C-like isoform X1 [Gossypium australe]|uniref:SWI/SNF complex subunit SWI3C-like isoform X1 n=1 Tax=Gossypium australe TaxID=47621 RepID=A0A5B6UIR3_9ROSI|nr:SWI/SNF complex subunit SWI3C-like isoform X1 [Gossypium australe]
MVEVGGSGGSETGGPSFQEDNDVPEEDVEEEDNNNEDIDNHRDKQFRDDAGGDLGIRLWRGPASVSSHLGVSPLVKRTVNRPHGSVMAIVAAERAGLAGDSKGHQQVTLAVLENVSYGQLQAVSTEAPIVEPEKYVITPPPIMEGRGVVKRFGSRVHVLPMHSEWFSPASVHRLERQYMDNPLKRITVSDCQGLIDGISNEDLTRIVRFLDHWGIINYCGAAPSHEPWSAGSYLREEPNGDVHVPSAALKSIDSLIKFDKPKCRLKAADVYPSLPCHADISDLDNRIRECLDENNCTSCSQPVATSYYQSQKEVDVLLCSDCFHDGRFVSGHSSIDFVRVDSTKDYGDLDGDSWSNQETLLLLEAMEIYNENWNEIAEHVGTKSKAQCILHFVRLPMEDGLLEIWKFRACPRPSLQDADYQSKVPFENSGNPVMAMVAFLASAVGPRVAAACAHASLAALAEDVDKEGSGHGNRMNMESVHSREGGLHGSVHQKENSAIHSFGQNEAEDHPLSAEKVKAAAKAGLAAAAMKAKLFADHEEREIQRLSANIINHQLKRLELKLKQFAEVETLLMKECEQVEKTRQKFAAERARIVSAQFGTTGVASQMSVPVISSPMVNNIGNNRQQVMSASPSTPSNSGYVNNQPVHPHMPFMQRQPMFPMGPRMPHTAMQASTSAPPNVMFNSPGNAQPTLNHPLMRSVSGTGSGLG